MEDKKFSLIIIITLVLISIFSIFAAAEEVDKQEFYQGEFFVGFAELFLVKII